MVDIAFSTASTTPSGTVVCLCLLVFPMISDVS